MSDQQMQFADPEWSPPPKLEAPQSTSPQTGDNPIEEGPETIIPPYEFDKLSPWQEYRRGRRAKEERRIGRRAFTVGLFILGAGTLGGLLWWVDRRSTSIVSAPHPVATITGQGQQVTGYPATVTETGPIRTARIPADPPTVIVQCDGEVNITGFLLREVDAHAFYVRPYTGMEVFSDHIRFSLNKPGNELTVTVDPPAQKNGKIYLNLSMLQDALLVVQANDNINVKNVGFTVVSLLSKAGGITFSGELTGTSNIHSAQGIQFLGSLSENGTYYFQSDQGNVELFLPEGTVFQLQATASGTLTNAFQSTNAEAFPQARLFITANHGDIVIKKSF